MKILKLVLLTTLLLGLLFLFMIPRLKLKARELLSYSKCDKPIMYRLGALDSRFGLSDEDIISSMKEAVDIWNNEYGKPLFIYSPNALLTVNLVYDERTDLNTDIVQLQEDLDINNKPLQQQIYEYEQDIKVFEKKVYDLNEMIDEVNRSGGATPDVYDSLISQQKELKNEGMSLNTRAENLDVSTNDYNSKVQTLKQNVDQFNEAIIDKPEEGLYDGYSNTITIYFADNHQELVQTLAHEFGHSLEMQHTEDVQSIMYAKSTSFILVTPEDREQLQYVCREQPVLTNIFISLRQWFYFSILPYLNN